MTFRGGWRLALAVFPLLLIPRSSFAEARSLEGFGNISILPGWRVTPNHHFYNAAEAVGFSRGPESPGGPSLIAGFSYAATEHIAVSIDLFGSVEQVLLQGVEPITSITYGANAGVRFQWAGLLLEDWVPYLGVFTGPTLIYTSSSTLGASETLTNGWSGAAGVAWRLGDRFALTLEYRLLLARGVVPDVGTINGGGSFFSLGLTVFFPPET